MVYLLPLKLGTIDLVVLPLSPDTLPDCMSILKPYQVHC